ncbi:MAG TPA: zinc-binding dehydrogenase, partial [Chloroflexota bacterium]
NAGGRTLKHFGGVSTFSEYTVVMENAALPVRKDVPLDRVALVGCGVMTGVGAVFNTAKVEPGSRVAIWGAGGVGLNVVQACAMVSADRIIVVDILDNKLEMARQFGATHTVNARDTDPVQAVRDLTDGYGADYTFEVIGNPRTIAQAYEAARPGGTAVVVGASPVGEMVSIEAASLVLQEKRLIGSLYGSTRPRVDMPRLLDLYVDGKLKLDELITRRYRLDQLNEAFAAMERGEVARSVVVYD